MCGIAGFAGRPKEKYEAAFKTFMDHLLVATSSRGEHATGIAAWIGGSKSIIGKGPVNATNFLKVPVWKKGLEAKSMIAHCRFATHGSPGKNENNHPFEQGRWAMIHNGVISEYRDIERAQGVKITSECDSEIILRVFAKGAKDGSAKKGLQKWADAIGPQSWSRWAIAILDRSNGEIRLLRNSSSPCSILRLPKMGVVFFASTKEILASAYDLTFKDHGDDTSWAADAESWECAPYKIYVLHPDSLEVDHEEVIRGDEFKPSTYGQAQIGFHGGTTTKKSTGVWSGSTDFKGGMMLCCPMCGQPECECGRTTQYQNEF